MSRFGFVFALIVMTMIEIGPISVCGMLWASQQIQTTLEKEKQKLQVFDFREKDLLEELARLEDQVAAKRGAVKELEEKIQEIQKISNELHTKKMTLEAEARSLEKKLAGRLVYLYKYARRGYMRVLAGAHDLDEFRKRVKYLSSLMEEDRNAVQELIVRNYVIKKKLMAIKERLAEADAKKRKEEENLSALKTDLENQVIRLMKIHKEKEFYETAVKELQAAGKNLRAAVLKAEHRPAKRHIKFENFAEFKGKLPLPVYGTVVKGKKLFRSKGVPLEKGIFIRGTTDSVVKAVLPGKVEYSGQLKGYGEVIIINHGGRFFTVSALLSKRFKREGDMVRGGEVIGKLGENGMKIGPSLYFEIREGGKNLDPLKWLKIPRRS